MGAKLDLQPTGYVPEVTTLWSFPERGNWATHSPDYRGNFAPQIARNIIEMYSDEGDNILDQMVGAGTTLIEAKLLNRNALGIDINPRPVELTNTALDFAHKTTTKQKAVLGDARHLDMLKDESVDLILTHPPYLNIIKYSEGKVDGDLSNIGGVDAFCDEMETVAREAYRVLKSDHYCAILIGDTRKSKHYVPLSYYVMQRFLKVGFALREEIIKAQHNCVYSKRWESRAKQMKFYLIMHEHLFVFRKPREGESLSKIKWSMGRQGLA
ncbi:MAG TPA: DNA methyltransferase [Candidatus Acidoferrum sp.]|nr:DNA methyltransferase [Candidatus Acidoferrum sp.]